MEEKKLFEGLKNSNQSIQNEKNIPPGVVLYKSVQNFMKLLKDKSVFTLKVLLSFDIL